VRVNVAVSMVFLSYPALMEASAGRLS